MLEKRPLHPDLSYVPPNAVKYRVKDGDSFFSLAERPEVRAVKMSAMDLCFFNFKTRDPREINWYLFNRVGCRKQTRDGQNYCFSAADTPGTIFLPSVDSGGQSQPPEECVGSRKDAIMNPVSGCWFVVSPNPDAKGDEPVLELSGFSDVDRYSAIIARVANESGVDGRLISAIMYMETTHGYYDAPLALIGKNKSILPMNINVEYWGDTFGDRATLNQPEANIRAGAEMIMRIQGYLPPGSQISRTATLYNNINAHQVSTYGARVQKIHETQPWLKKGKK